MEYAQKVVADIVARCKYHGVEVSETLAAFAARMIVHKSKRRLVLDQAMAPEDEQFLVDQCVRVLRQEGEPALEAVKMQLEFDFTYANLEEELRARREHKKRAVESLQRNISQLVPQKASDFETLTALYKQIFTLLLVDADALSSSSDNKTTAQLAEQRAVEKEVAAALESVFPRVGLKSFVTMSAEDKRFQLDELARIVEGIRLFNKELGKGGAGISVTVDFIQENVEQLARSVKDEVQETNEVCTLYTEVLLHIHHHHKSLRAEGKEQDASSLSAELSSAQLERWQDELSNRRQLLSYLQSLDEDISFASDKIRPLLATFRSDLSALKNLVGARTSLPKSHVYPLFEAVAKSWRELLGEHELLQTRSRALKALLTFKDSFRRSLDLDSEFLRQAKRSGSIPSDKLFAQVETFAPEEHLGGDGGASRTSSSSSTGFRIKGSFAPAAERDIDDEDMNEDKAASTGEEDGGFPIRMPVDSTPEFMQLPLEYQGFCPWTVVERGGLLLPGDPSLGVVQYRNAYHVFVNERALGEFMTRPQRYVRGVRRAAAKQPALIYLLRLQDTFPRLSLSSLLKLCQGFQSETGVAHPASVHPLLAPPSSQKVDASTSTPTHFVDKHMDFQYEWNEWRLRRRALQLANLRQCRTVSCQTQLSAFRREAGAQVYLPRDSGTQTNKERGTNPPRVTTYFAGLRGTSGVHKAIAGGDDGKEVEDDGDDNQAAVIAFAYDP